MLHRDGASFRFLSGGRIKFSKTASEAAARECAEESTIGGINLEFAGQIENFFRASTRPFHEVMQFFCAHLTADKVDGIRHEESDSTTAQWLPIDDAMTQDLRREAAGRNLKRLRNEVKVLIHADEAWQAAHGRS